MMMLFHVAVEASRGCKVIGSPHYAEISQSFQRPIDGCPGNPRNAVLHLRKNLVHRRVIVALEQRRENHPALHRQGYSFPPADRLETVKITLFVI